MSSTIKLLLIFCIFGSITKFTNANTTCPRLSKNIVCYWESWSVDRIEEGKFVINEDMKDSLNLCTHMIYTFADLTLDGVIKPLDKFNDIDNYGYRDFVAMKTKNHCLKVLLAIGVWNAGSTTFSTVAGSPILRQKFADNAVEFLTKYKFDGLDMDWKYPAQRGGLLVDKNFILLIKELKSKFLRKSLLLTAAVPAIIYSMDIPYNVKEMCKTLDFVNIMSYNMQQSGTTSIHSPLKFELFDRPNTIIIDNIINYYEKEGCPLNKINLGIPSYGRSFKLLYPTKTNIGALTSGVAPNGRYTNEPGNLGYNEICSSQKKEQGWHTKLLQQNAAVYAWRNDLWVSYDDPSSIAIKGKYVLDKGLGGLMFWAIDTDDFRGICSNKKYPLLTAAKKSLKI